MKFVTLVVELICMVSSSWGITTPAFGVSFDASAADGIFSMYNATMTSDGVCLCQIKSPKTMECTPNTETKERIDQLRTETSQISVRLRRGITDVEWQGSQITNLTGTMMEVLNKLEKIESDDMVGSRPEYEQLRREIVDMEALLVILKRNQNGPSPLIDALELEIANITEVVNNLQEHEEADTSRLLAEIRELKKRLQDCQENLNKGGNLQKIWDQPENKQDTCHKLKSVSSPNVVQRNSGRRGTWFRDPIKDQHKVYALTLSNNRYSNIINVYPTVTEFHNSINAERLTLPQNVQGTGMVAYNGSLFFNVYNGIYIGKYDIELKRLKRVQLPSDTLYSGNGDYLSKTYTDIDFAIDESGLWVIYSRSSSNGVMIISKVNPETLALTKNWTTSLHKSNEGDCFVTCEVLYCTDNFNTNVSNINYYFDTKTSAEGFLHVPIENKFKATYALTYNPYDQKLYGWDNGYQVSYEFIFEENA